MCERGATISKTDEWYRKYLSVQQYPAMANSATRPTVWKECEKALLMVANVSASLTGRQTWQQLLWS